MLSGTKKALRKVLEKAATRLKKGVQGTKSSFLAFGCDKSANLVPENCKKVEVWSKRHLKAQTYTCIEAWKSSVRCFFKRN